MSREPLKLGDKFWFFVKHHRGLKVKQIRLFLDSVLSFPPSRAFFKRGFNESNSTSKIWESSTFVAPLSGELSADRLQ